MNRGEFEKKYSEILARAEFCLDRVHKEGFIALYEEIDYEKINERDIFEYGLRLFLEGETSREYADEILSNIINQEKDENAQVFKTMQKKAVFMIQDKVNPRVLRAVLNSFTAFNLDEGIPEAAMDELALQS